MGGQSRPWTVLQVPQYAPISSHSGFNRAFIRPIEGHVDAHLYWSPKGAERRGSYTTNGSSNHARVVIASLKGV